LSETTETKTTKLIVSDSEAAAVSAIKANPDTDDISVTKVSFAPEPAKESSAKSEAPRFAKIGGVDFFDRSQASTVIKDLPMDEFLRLVEGASPEELQSLLVAADEMPKVNPATAKPFGVLFDPLESRKTNVMSILGWWERRRLFYNVIVGACGLLTVALVASITAGRFLVDGLVISIIPVAFIANVCYTSGWLLDSYARAIWKEKAEHFGPILFSLGLLFSMIVVLSPIIVMCIIVVGRL
jgi:hypothetical protein